MILSEIILNKSGLIVHFAEGNVTSVMENINDDIILHFFSERENLEEQSSSPLTLQLNPRIKGRAYFQEEDTYIIIYQNQISETEIKDCYQRLLQTRQQLKGRLQGIAFGWMDDILGPDCLFEIPRLPEGVGLALITQSCTLLGLGMGEGFRKGIFGPIPVPKQTHLQVLVYQFLIQDPDSNDPRYVQLGRPCYLYFIFHENDEYLHSQAFQRFLESFLENNFPSKITQLDLENIMEIVRASFLLAADTEKAQREEQKMLLSSVKAMKGLVNKLGALAQII